MSEWICIVTGACVCTHTVQTPCTHRAHTVYTLYTVNCPLHTVHTHTRAVEIVLRIRVVDETDPLAVKLMGGFIAAFGAHVVDRCEVH